jgi:propanol-preferring alcohol dehydrogenase
VGADVHGLAVGDRVGVPWLGGSCGHCRYCRLNPKANPADTKRYGSSSCLGEVRKHQTAGPPKRPGSKPSLVRVPPSGTWRWTRWRAFCAAWPNSR